MFIQRHIERHQLPCVLKVYNRFTDQQIGYLGNASEDGLMLISHLPVLVGPDFELQLRLPVVGGGVQCINLTASCLWCREDQTPATTTPVSCCCSPARIRRLRPGSAQLLQLPPHQRLRLSLRQRAAANSWVRTGLSGR